ncbi:MAG: hypothetical protein JWL96_3145 [Sphingomonas bacterium]|nr:hypothetical protein [Sphingomonas bacterium]
MIAQFNHSSPARGGGPRAQRVVEGGLPQAKRVGIAPSTMLRMVPLPVPGRI